MLSPVSGCGWIVQDNFTPNYSINILKKSSLWTEFDAAVWKPFVQAGWYVSLFQADFAQIDKSRLQNHWRAVIYLLGL
jgi:hypothetical protein